MKRLLESKTQLDVKQRSGSVLNSISRQLKPESIAGQPISEWENVARVEANGRGDRSVHLVVNGDCSKSRLGEGVLWTRLKDYICCFAINESPILRITEPRWSNDPNLIELIRETTSQENRLFYVVLADGLTKDAVKAGKKALFDRFGIRRDGGWLINQAMR